MKIPTSNLHKADQLAGPYSSRQNFGTFLAEITSLVISYSRAGTEKHHQVYQPSKLITCRLKNVPDTYSFYAVNE